MKPTANDIAKDPKAELRMESLGTLAPLGIFTGCCLIGNPMVAWVLNESGVAESFFLMFCLGAFFGQFLLLNMIAGLCGRHWVIGYTASVLLAGAGIGVFYLFFGARQSESDTAILFFSCLPLGLGIACLPHFAFRLFRNWRIASTDRPSFKFRIQDLMMVMTILGCAIALTRSYYLIGPRYITNGDSGLFFDSVNSIWFFFGLYFFVINLLTMPAVLLAFRPEPFILRAIYVGSYALLLWLLLAAILMVLSGGRSGESIWYFLLLVATAALVALVGTECLRMAGLNLWSKRDDRLRPNSLPIRNYQIDESNQTSEFSSDVSTKEPPVIDPWSDEADLAAHAHREKVVQALDSDQLLARWLTLGWVLFTILFSLFCYCFGSSAGFDYPSY
jgi:hypothetical protein